MLYLIRGENTFEARRKAREITKNLLARDAKAEFWRVTPENFDEEKFADITGGQNLFGRKSVVVLDGILKSELSNFLVSSIGSMAESKNVYLILEEKPEAKLVKRILRHAQKTEKFAKLSDKEAKKWTYDETRKRELGLSEDEAGLLAQNLNFNLWAIANALDAKELGGEIEFKKFFYEPFKLPDLFAQKNRRAAFAHFHENLASGVSAEEMFWKLWWQTKTLLAVSFHKEAGQNNLQIKTSTGLHPFVVQKSLSALSGFTRGEIERIWGDLFFLWRKGRGDASKFTPGLERLILGL